MSNFDLKNRQRGKCSCGKCDEFFLPNPADLSTKGWCIYCNCPPVEHELIRRPDSSVNDSCGSESITVENLVSHSQGSGEISDNDVTQEVKKKPTKHFPLPEFSEVLKPFLNGECLNDKDRKQLSSILKEEIISFLNRKNLILGGNASTLRWGYRNLGEALAMKYPNMIWDAPSHRQKKVKKANAPIYSVFIRRLSERRKMQRLRQKCKERKETQLRVEETKDVEVSAQDALAELKSVTSEAVRNNSNTGRIAELLRKSFKLREKEEISELPEYLMTQTFLETEVELRLQSPVDEMEKKLLTALSIVTAAFLVPGTVFELEKLVQPRRATSNAITMEDYSKGQTRPGPSLFYGKRKKVLLSGDQLICLDDSCSLERASILLLGVYFVLNLNFPAEYGQFLGLLQNILVSGKKNPKTFSSDFLLQVIKTEV